jgi:hypothetical protein
LEGGLWKPKQKQQKDQRGKGLSCCHGKSRGEFRPKRRGKTKWKWNALRGPFAKRAHPVCLEKKEKEKGRETNKNNKEGNTQTAVRGEEEVKKGRA